MSDRKNTLVTSSWRVPLDPDTYQRIGISLGTRGVSAGFRRYRALEPGKWFNSVSPREYLVRYSDDVLAPLKAEKVLADLIKLANGKVPVLCCWEHPPPDRTWCHRALVSAWFKDQLGLDVPELGHEHAGCGWAHPKLHPTLRKAVSAEPSSARAEARPAPQVPNLASRIKPHIGKIFHRKPKRGEQIGYVVVRQDHEHADHVVVKILDGPAEGREMPVPFSSVEKYLT